MVSQRPERIDPAALPVRSARAGRIRLELIAVTIIVSYLLLQGSRGLWRQYEMNERYRNLSRQIEAEKALQEQQQQNLVRLKDPRYIEFLARDRLGLVKRGEKVYKLAEPERGVQK